MLAFQRYPWWTKGRRGERRGSKISLTQVAEKKGGHLSLLPVFILSILLIYSLIFKSLFVDGGDRFMCMHAVPAEARRWRWIP